MMKKILNDILWNEENMDNNRKWRRNSNENIEMK